MRVIEIDGSYGEGGGQILRTSLALATLLQKPVRIDRVRKNRKKPGLGMQHLTALRALARISRATVDGDRIGSTTVHYRPGKIEGGAFRFDVSETRGSAGSVSLIFQALLLPLLFARSDTTLELIGGTHVPWSPTYHYLEAVFLPILRRMGGEVEVRIDRWGWYPIGGGIFRARVKPTEKLIPIVQLDRVPIRRLFGLSASSNLPEHVRHRQSAEVVRRLSGRGIKLAVEEIDAPAVGMGSCVFLATDPEEAHGGFSALGARGKPAERVAQEACEAFEAFDRSRAVFDPHLTDQLLPYLALADGTSSISISAATRHLTTQIWLLSQFLPRSGTDLRIPEDGPGSLRVDGIGGMSDPQVDPPEITLSGPRSNPPSDGASPPEDAESMRPTERG